MKKEIEEVIKTELNRAVVQEIENGIAAQYSATGEVFTGTI